VLHEVRAAREPGGCRLDALGGGWALRRAAKRESRHRKAGEDDEAEGRDEEHPNQFFHEAGIMPRLGLKAGA